MSKEIRDNGIRTSLHATEICLRIKMNRIKSLNLNLLITWIVIGFVHGKV